MDCIIAVAFAASLTHSQTIVARRCGLIQSHAQSINDYPERRYPHFFTTQNDKPKIWEKIYNQAWAAKAFDCLVKEVEPYADQHLKDPQWITSRLAMYWKEGEHYTQCYLRDQCWDYGEGNAPVPTMRMPGMRKWNKYQNVPLAERTPYNETGDMWAIDPYHPSTRVLIPHRKSGHMIRNNNVEILTLAEKAAFLYFMIGKEKYASFANDVFRTWLLGTYFMNPIIDPKASEGGKGGYAPGGICGYYDYEQIHDELGMHAAIIYDFIHEYADNHPHPYLKVMRQTTKAVTDTVMRRFCEIGMVRGGRTGNWNVNGWNMILLPALTLDSDSAYSDGHGREYYLRHFLSVSTPWHEALPDIMKNYDAHTGLWPESPGYAFGIINTLCDFLVILKRQGIDILREFPFIEKAALAVIPWLDARGNMIVFGDYRGGHADFTALEDLLTYYVEDANEEKARRIAAIIQQSITCGNYSRANSSWKGICNYSQLPNVNLPTAAMTSYAPFHQVAVLKNAGAKLMAVLYGGRNGNHLSPNVLALQLYGFEYALAPDAAAYESYWSDDYNYHQSVTGSNTILPGYTSGPVVVNRMDSNFVSMTAGEKTRNVAMIDRGGGKGYYVDVFYSAQQDNDYLFHGIGKCVSLSLFNGKTLVQKKTAWDPDTILGYRYFRNVRAIHWKHDFIADWKVTDNLHFRMWMAGGADRTIFTMDAPPSTSVHGLMPNDASCLPSPTPTILVRQRRYNAGIHPFVSVFEPYRQNAEIIATKLIHSDDKYVQLIVTFFDGSQDEIIITTKNGLTVNHKENTE